MAAQGASDHRRGQRRLWQPRGRRRQPGRYHCRRRSATVAPVSGSADILHLTWDSELPHGCVRVGRHILRPEKRYEFGVHDHEFAEFMWIDAGRCEHVINGAGEVLEPDEWRCIRPHDVHLTRSDGVECTLINISFQPGPLSALAERYGHGQSSP